MKNSIKVSGALGLILAFALSACHPPPRPPRPPAPPKHPSRSQSEPDKTLDLKKIHILKESTYDQKA